MNLSSYLEQHKSINEEIVFIQNRLIHSKVEEEAEDIALHINQLSGRLKVHLMNEDKFLYPSFMASQDEKIRQMATEYQVEMGGLQDTFKTFKEKYNTKSKILENKASFIKEADVILKAVLERISREEKGIYKFI